MTIEYKMTRRILGEEVLVLNIRTILHEEGADDVAVVAVNLCCKIALRVFQLLE